MPIAVVKRITAWSISRLRDYELCPYLCKGVHIDGRKKPGSPAMDRGGDIHSKAELYLKKKMKVLAPELESFKKEFVELRQDNLGSEIKWSFDVKWQRLTDNTVHNGFFHPRTWLRVVADAAKKIVIRKKPGVNLIDFKTGKHTEAKVEEYHDQLKLYAPAALIVYPWAEVVRGSLWFTDAGVPEKRDYTRDELPTLINEWNERVKPMFADTKFAPRPGHYCSWCHLSKSNNGPCKF